ncbi:hypothetical protein [Maridesulfovibrio ferrireducens]|uniref:hypothetical protein n=1 Tax=Maridesulfovibrio ferrireducens TaxID=246191 RepID=UPI001A2FE29F|nr:hypothetical protein [Maridesulfovibrio ferrireducens]MBI9113246.1 hypothetical protein [Maridesulfovibrio ferrireducens]MBI9113275.1 hypothetical protein [Maridesulfovibrio ferrireducens]
MDFTEFENIEVNDDTAEMVAGAVTAIAGFAGLTGPLLPFLGLAVNLGLKLCDGGYECHELPTLKKMADGIEVLPDLTVE